MAESPNNQSQKQKQAQQQAKPAAQAGGPLLGTAVIGAEEPVVTTVVSSPLPALTPIAEMRSKLCPEALVIIGRIEEYIVAMNPKKPISPVDGARWQVVLYRNLTQLINGLETDFRETLEVVLDLFVQHREGSLSHLATCRFPESIPLPSSDRAVYFQLMNLFNVAADPVNRKTNMRQVSLEATLTNGISERGRNKMFEFFNI